MENANKISSDNFSNIAKQTLAQMWKDVNKGLFCDVVLIAGEDKKKISAHRAVLSARSDFFRTMFSSQFKESNDKEVQISQVSGNILKALIRYCYIGTININKKNVQLILSQASIMLFQEIVESCLNFLISSINTENCLEMVRYAKLYNCHSLLESAEEHMKDNFVNVVETDAFLKLSQEELEKYLLFDGLNVANEKDVFKAMIQWIDYDLETRSSALSKLLSLIRLNCIEDNFLLKYALNSAHKKYHLTLLDGIKKNLFKPQTMPERRGNPKKIVIVCERRIQIYNHNKKVVEFKYDYNSDDSFTPVLVGEKLIFFGFFGSCEIIPFFNLNTISWHHLEKRLTGRHYSVAVLNDNVYVLGGMIEYRALSNAEKWDSKSNKWKTISRMNYSRYYHCTATLNGKLYVIGGVNMKQFLNSVECYNPTTNKWNNCSPMLTKRAHARAIVVSGKIYVFGGLGSTQTLTCIEKYNPETDTWTKVSEMCCERHNVGAYLFNNKIYLFGGLSVQYKSMEEFDPATNQCKIISTPNIEHAGTVYCFPYFPKKNVAVISSRNVKFFALAAFAFGILMYKYKYNMDSVKAVEVCGPQMHLQHLLQKFTT